MVERGNVVHCRILEQVTQLDHETQEWADALCQSQESSIPPPTLRETLNPYHSDSDEPDDFIEDPTTHGRIYLQDASAVIHRFAADLRSVDTVRAPRPLFKFGEKRGGRPYCTIVLPGSPIHGISGSHSFSISHARRAACYKACLELHKKGFLDYRLFPLPSSISAREEQQNRDVGGAATEQNNLLPLGARWYPRKKPNFWSDAGSTIITSLYPTIISTNYSNDSSQPHAPMLILTRRPLPTLEKFKLFFSGIPADVCLTPCAEFQLDEERLNDIYQYTIRVCRAIGNKPFFCPLASMEYFFAPLGLAWREPPTSRWELPNVIDDILWPLVSLAARTWIVELQPDGHGITEKDIEDAVIQDRRDEFTRRYEAVRMRTDLSPLSKPIDSPVRHHWSISFVADNVVRSEKQNTRTWLSIAKHAARTSMA
jgi:endoribonuclease Dicer